MNPASPLARLQAGVEPEAHRPLDIQAEVLRGHLADLRAPLPVFMVGDLVRQKRGLDLYQEPRAGTIGIVTELLPPDTMDLSVGSGSVYYRRPLHMRVGVAHDEGFRDFAVDARCFELVAAGELQVPPATAAD